MRAGLMCLVSVTLASVLGSCGKIADGDLQLDSNTNWLKRCETGAECSGALVCLCGQCTQPCSETPECGLLAGATCGSASGGACAANPGAGGLCVLECTTASECDSAEFTCINGQCAPLPRDRAPAVDDVAAGMDDAERSGACSPGESSLDMDDVFELIVDDLSGEDADDQLNYRYVSLANLYNAGLCQAELDVERAALIKAVNSVSRSSAVEVPLQVDALGLIYRIDLRDYDWDEAVIANGQRYNDAWEALVQQDVFTVPWVGDDADLAVILTGASSPVMFASSLISGLTRASTYYGLLGIQNVDAYVTDQLGIDTAANLAAQSVIRAGFSGATLGFADGAFVAERHVTQTRNGYLWQIGQFGSSSSELFAHALGHPTGERVLVFTLPNMFLAFAFTDASGAALETSGVASAVNPALRLRASFAQYAGGVRVSDEVYSAAMRGDLAGHVNVEDMQRVLSIYPSPEQLSSTLDADSDFYARAITRANLDFDAPDPITRAYSAFERDLDVNAAAGDLMRTSDSLLRDLGELDESLRALDGGEVSRNAFAFQYVRALCILSVALQNTVDPDLCDNALSRP